MEANLGQKGGHLISVDTGVVVRLCVRDNPDQVEAALKLLSGAPAATIRVSVIVLAEPTSTLLRRYRLDKAALIATVDSLLPRGELDIEGRCAVMVALQWYRKGNADFADDLVAALNRETGATPTHTFDEQATSSPVFALLS